MRTRASGAAEPAGVGGEGRAPSEACAAAERGRERGEEAGVEGAEPPRRDG